LSSHTHTNGRGDLAAEAWPSGQHSRLSLSLSLSHTHTHTRMASLN
jgi:hypothetical protein